MGRNERPSDGEHDVCRGVRHFVRLRQLLDYGVINQLLGVITLSSIVFAAVSRFDLWIVTPPLSQLPDCSH